MANAKIAVTRAGVAACWNRGLQFDGDDMKCIGSSRKGRKCQNKAPSHRNCGNKSQRGKYTNAKTGHTNALGDVKRCLDEWESNQELNGEDGQTGCQEAVDKISQLPSKEDKKYLDNSCPGGSDAADDAADDGSTTPNASSGSGCMSKIHFGLVLDASFSITKWSDTTVRACVSICICTLPIMLCSRGRGRII